MPINAIYLTRNTLNKFIKDQIMTAEKNTIDTSFKLVVDHRTIEGKNIARQHAILAVDLLKLKPIKYIKIAVDVPMIQFMNLTAIGL